MSSKWSKTALNSTVRGGEWGFTLQASPALHEARKSQPGHRVRGARAHTEARLAGEGGRRAAAAM